MKIAICFYGLVGSSTKKYGLGKKLDPSIAYQYYQKNVFKNLTNFDVFIHSQSIERKNLFKTMKAWNGKVVEFKYTKGISSTKLKRKII